MKINHHIFKSSLQIEERIYTEPLETTESISDIREGIYAYESPSRASIRNTEYQGSNMDEKESDSLFYEPFYENVTLFTECIEEEKVTESTPASIVHPSHSVEIEYHSDVSEIVM